MVLVEVWPPVDGPSIASKASQPRLHPTIVQPVKLLGSELGRLDGLGAIFVHLMEAQFPAGRSDVGVATAVDEGVEATAALGDSELRGV
jgi:hypothetical protein